MTEDAHANITGELIKRVNQLEKQVQKQCEINRLLVSAIKKSQLIDSLRVNDLDVAMAGNLVLENMEADEGVEGETVEAES